MKDRPDAILRAAQASYLDRLLPPRDAHLAALEERAAREGIPISDPEVGRLLTLLARASGAGAILEIGTAIGYGTLCLARGAPEARLLSIDPDPARLAVAGEALAAAGVLDRVELVCGQALEVLPSLAVAAGGALRFDLVYLDAVKTEYRRYLDLVLPMLRVGGMIVVDNLLWKGRIAEPDPEPAPEARAISAFNGYLMGHPQLVSVLLPLGDGVGLATKTKALVTERGGPI